MVVATVVTTPAAGTISRRMLLKLKQTILIQAGLLTMVLLVHALPILLLVLPKHYQLTIIIVASPTLKSKTVLTLNQPQLLLMLHKQSSKTTQVALLLMPQLVVLPLITQLL
jgi:hypothetical protein